MPDGVGCGRGSSDGLHHVGVGGAPPLREGLWAPICLLHGRTEHT